MEKRFRFGRKGYYLGVLVVGVIWGLFVGIGGRNCSKPGQPPFIECLAEDPIDVVFPMVVIVVYLVVLAALLDLLYRAMRRSQWITVGSALVGGSLGAWWSVAVGEFCRQEAADVVGCYAFSGWPDASVPILFGALVSGTLGFVVTRMTGT